jgi:hypothetical protein
VTLAAALVLASSHKNLLLLVLVAVLWWPISRLTGIEVADALAWLAVAFLVFLAVLVAVAAVWSLFEWAT